MLVVIGLAARWVVRRHAPGATALRRLAAGMTALGLLVFTELALVLWLPGFTIQAYLASRDPVAGTVYLVMLGVLAIAPVLAGWNRRSHSG